MKMIYGIPCFLSFFVLVGNGQADDELVKEINYIENIGNEAKSEIVCINNESAFMYENNHTKEINIEKDGVSEYFGKVTIDEIIEKVCR